MVASLLRTPASLFADFDRLQRELERGFGVPASIRAAGGASFPAINVAGGADAIEVFAFAPGVDAATLEVTVDNNLLTIAGERRLDAPAAAQTVYAEERFGGKFRRVVSLPDDVDSAQVDARYTDGVLRVRIQRRAAQQARRITIN